MTGFGVSKPMKSFNKWTENGDPIDDDEFPLSCVRTTIYTIVMLKTRISQSKELSKMPRVREFLDRYGGQNGDGAFCHIVTRHGYLTPTQTIFSSSCTANDLVDDDEEDLKDSCVEVLKNLAQRYEKCLEVKINFVVSKLKSRQ